MERLKIDQSNVFYNYTIGLSITEIDLLRTAKKLLNSGLTTAVCFSDMKFLYFDQNGELQVELMQLGGRYWDNIREVNINQKNTSISSH
ncbi:MAG: hypothetical protein HGB15_10305 [Chlorobaculum sp.]|nr:hypothetical protein [Chlorobaculum sp.]